MKSMDHSTSAASRRIIKGLQITTIIVLAIMIAGFSVSIRTITDSCPYTHRTGTVMEDGSIRYIQGEPQYFTPEQSSGVFAYLPGDKLNLCFNTATDEFIRICPDQEEQSAFFVFPLLFACGTSIVLLLGYLALCHLTPFGSAYFNVCRQARKAEKEAEKEQIPVTLQFTITVAAIILALLIVTPLMFNLAQQIQRFQRINDRQELITDAAQKAEDAFKGIEEMEQALETMNTDAAADAIGAAGNIGDILDGLNRQDSPATES